IKTHNLAIIPIKIFNQRNLFKLEIALARGKKKYDIHHLMVVTQAPKFYFSNLHHKLAFTKAAYFFISPNPALLFIDLSASNAMG
ncbi:MAG: SsrA-binding protein, partial [Sweet potato little leaf phytoplasma]|nr:SsrA-binding protein [Sweet potato little leaf phytoplasma]